jgi:dipeptidyl aminopeptidase/acylaminoacyl peptidase
MLCLKRSASIALVMLAGTCLPLLADDAPKAAPKPTVAPSAMAALTNPLIPRAVLFGNPDKAQGRVSPDGKMVSYLAPVNGVLNVWVGPADDVSKAKPVTTDDKRGIRQYFWAFDAKHIVYLQDKGGDENWRVYSVEVDTGKAKDLTPMDGVAAQIEGVSRDFPDTILVGLNDREPHQFHDLYAINISTGDRKLVVKNDEYAGFVTDDKFRVRMAVKPTADGGVEYLKAKDMANPGAGFEPDFKVPQEDMGTTEVEGFSADGETMYLIDSRGRNTGALFKRNLKTGETTLVQEDEKTDISGVMVNPITREIEAVQTNYDKETWSVIDRSIERDFYAIRTQMGQGDINITSRSLDDRFWTVTLVDDNGPAKTWLLDRGDMKGTSRKPKATLLFANKAALAEAPLVPMKPVEIKTRDGMTMMCYLTVPLSADPDGDGKPDKAVPMVLNVHGGPWARDSFGFDPEAQWLANRGYACLQVNFRGSTGFGKKFLNAANKEWAGTMHEDLLDSVKWAVDQKIADPARVAIMGGSYGGYATLVGLTFTPDTFACGVDIVGPSNLNTLLASIPPYWKPMLESMYIRLGDPRTEEGKKLLEDRSPLNHVDKIKKPLLIGQGANDPRVKQAEADQIVKAMQAKKTPVTYVLYPDEGHGFARPENRMSFYAVAEAFLAQHLGGRAEPIGDAFRGSSIQVPAGADGVPGLADAMKK